LGGVLRHGHDLLRRSSKSTEDTHGGVWSRPTRSTSPVTMTPVVVARQADHVVVAGISSRARSGRRVSMDNGGAAACGYGQLSCLARYPLAESRPIRGSHTGAAWAPICSVMQASHACAAPRRHLDLGSDQRGTTASNRPVLIQSGAGRPSLGEPGGRPGCGALMQIGAAFPESRRSAPRWRLGDVQLVRAVVAALGMRAVSQLADPSSPPAWNASAMGIAGTAQSVARSSVRCVHRITSRPRDLIPNRIATRT
jgi:hypothetical protein